MVSRRRLAAAGTAALALASAVVAPSCGSGFMDGLTGGSREAGAVEAAPPDAAAPDARACVLAHAPARPVIPDEDAPGTLQFAVDALRIDDTEADAAIPPGAGLDLDQACTCPEPDTCVPPSGAKRCDRDGGADNALGRLFGILAHAYPAEFDPDFVTNRIRRGDYTLLIGISGWNHKPDDPNVVVAIALSQGLEGRVDGGTDQPRLDGTDVWTIDPASVVDGDSHIGTDCEANPTDCFPTHLSSDAWVTGGVLVARGDAPLSVSTTSSRIDIQLDDVVTVARLFDDGGVTRLQGQLTGRWAVSRVLASLGSVQLNGTPLCNEEVAYQAAKEQVCNVVDLASQASLDGTGKPCESLSAALSFSALTAHRGVIYAGDTTPPTTCPNQGDSCQKQ